MAMSRLAGAIDGVIGVDPHRDTWPRPPSIRWAACWPQTSVRADTAGYRQLFGFAQARVPGRRCWAVEGAGSYGAGLATFLQARGEWVVEVGRPKRPPRRTGAKSDALDAVRAAREALIGSAANRTRAGGFLTDPLGLRAYPLGFLAELCTADLGHAGRQHPLPGAGDRGRRGSAVQLRLYPAGVRPDRGAVQGAGWCLRSTGTCCSTSAWSWSQIPWSTASAVWSPCRELRLGMRGVEPATGPSTPGRSGWRHRSSRSAGRRRRRRGCPGARPRPPGSSPRPPHGPRDSAAVGVGRSTRA